LCAKAYANWNETGNEDSFKVRLWNLWEDSDGDYYQDGNEPSGAPLHVGPYSVQVCLIVYADSDDSGGYSGGDDTVYQVVKSQSEITYELTNEPYINQLNPKSVERNRRFRIFGMNFGPTQTSGEVHVGTLKQFNTDPIGKGKVQPASRIKLWSNTKIAVRLRVPPSWAGKARRVWVVKDDMVSNSRKLTILP
jgi:hypothetical protein